MAQVHAITNYSKSGNSTQERRRKKTRLARQRSDTPKRTVHTAQWLFEQAEKGFPDHFRSQNEKRAARESPLVGHCMQPATRWKFAQSIIPRAHLRAARPMQRRFFHEPVSLRFLFPISSIRCPKQSPQERMYRGDNVLSAQPTPAKKHQRDS